MKAPISILAAALSVLAAAQGYDAANYSFLTWDNVGPARGGRSVACTGVRTRPKEFYFGATGGGLWKSTDAGEHWSCVTDGFLKSSSVGAIAVSDSNPDVIYIGMGERDIRGNVAEGDGVYKSSDAGKTWKNVGLEATRTVSRIQIDPKNPDVVYVAALGHVWGADENRGVYKSTDGGKSWSKILFVSDRAGAVDLCIQPDDSNTLYAATWEAWRKPYELNSGGPGSHLWKSPDGGVHWNDITRSPGLPSGIVGKIGISVSAANPKRVFVIEEATDGGIFRSDDSGANWIKLTDDHKFTQRAWYFSHIYADTKNADKVYCLNTGTYSSSDAGKTWTGMRISHGDNHDMWINPDDPKCMIESNDGGASATIDGGKNWSKETYNTAQFYHVATDTHVPYRIYGAQQDNSAVRISPYEPNRPTHQNWDNTAGGESGYIVPKPDDPEIVFGGGYGGALDRLNHRTGLDYAVDPWPDNPMGHGAEDLEHRFQWTYPIVFSPHDANTLYVGSQYVLKSTDGGHSWKKISPDLTRNDRSTMKATGGPITKDNTSIEYYGTVFTIAESPAKRGVIWTGSDDGLVQVTTDAGKTWKNVTPSGMPHWGRVSMVEASPNDANSAYVAVNNYQNDDTAPYLYRTHNGGKTWQSIVSGIPAGSFLRVCREDPHRKGLLYAGTETGAFVSFNDGDSWQPLQLNLPLVPVHDLAIKDDDLIAATHGRSFWILHNVSILEELIGSSSSKPVLFAPRQQYRYESASAKIDYFLPSSAKIAKLEVLDPSGHVLATPSPLTEAGMHRTTANLAHPAFHAFQGMVFWAGFPQPIPAPPGDYTVRLTIDGQVQTQPLRLMKDPRIEASEKDLVEQYDFAVEVCNRVSQANDAVLRIRDMRKQIDESVKASKDGSAISAKAEELKGVLQSVEEAIHQTKSTAGEDPLNFPIRLNDKLSGVLSNVESGPSKPTSQAREAYAILSRLLQVQLDTLKVLEDKQVVAFNALLKAKGVVAIKPTTPPPSNKTFSFGDEEEDADKGG